MSRENRGPGGCLITILIILVIGAAFGFVDWSTVGSYTRFLVYLVLAGVILIGGFFIWIYFSKNDE